MIRVGVYDESYINDDIERIILDYAKDNKINIDVDIMNNFEELLDFFSNCDLDILFINKCHAYFNNIYVGEYIRNKLNNFHTQIVFLSDYDNISHKELEVMPVEDLVRPIKKKDVYHSLNRALDFLSSNYSIFRYKEMNHYRYVKYAEILYFESMDRKVIIHTIDSSFEFYGSLKTIKEIIPTYFCRIHNSFIVNFNHVSIQKRDSVILDNNVELPISKSHIKEMKDIVNGLEIYRNK